METAAELKTKYADAVTTFETARKRMYELKDLLDTALIAEAAHPWLGKEVTRKVAHGYCGKTVSKYGVVTTYDPKKHRRLRELRTYGLEAGHPIVVHKNGVTGWVLSEPPHSRTLPWQLVEAA